MVSLLDMLPMLQGWSFIRVNSEKTVEAGGDVTLYESADNQQGWLLGATFGSDQKDASLQITYNTAETGQTITFALKPDDLYSAHRISPNGLGPYVAVYDDTNSVYEVVYSPAVPFPFDGTIDINAVAGASDANISADVQIIAITDYETFAGGLRHLLGVSDIEGYLNSILQANLTTVQGINALLRGQGYQPIEVRLEEELENLPTLPSIQSKQQYRGFLP